MDSNKILNLISLILKNNNEYIVIKENGEIIYPSDKEIISTIDSIKNNKINNNKYKFNNLIYQIANQTIEYDNNIYEIEFIRDITRIKKLQFKNMIDGATNLYNKDTILKKLDLAILNNKVKSIIVVMSDIDLFKYINDNYSHIIGDEVLKNVANILNKNINKIGKVGRYGGDEFIFIFQNTTIEKVEKIINNIKNDIKKINVSYENEEIKKITMSFGISKINRHEIQDNDILSIRERIISEADDALYESKENGRNRLTIYEKKD